MSSKLNSVREVYRKFKPKLIVCDFDGTMTFTETITPLLHLAEKKWSPLEVDGFRQQMEWYEKNHSQHKQTLFSDLNQYRDDLVQHKQFWDIDDLIPYFKPSDDLEVESLDKLNANGKYLANLQLNDVAELFEQHIRPDVIELLQEFINDNCVIKILSHNWSSYSIYNALHHIIRQDNIICNEMNCDKYNMTTGELLCKCVTSLDKLHYFLKWNNLYIQRYQDNAGKLSMYVGDNIGDFLASCCADISVWIRTDHNQNFIEVASDKYLMNKNEHEQHTESSLFVVDSWK